MTLRSLCKATTAALLLSNSASPCRSQTSILSHSAAATFMTSPSANGHVAAAQLQEEQAEEIQHGAANNAEQVGASSKKPLLLPSPGEAAARTTDPHTLTVGGEGLKMDHLGPIVLNRDGTLSRIGNWDEMTEPERCATRRMVAKRNLQRKKMLEEQEQSGM